MSFDWMTWSVEAVGLLMVSVWVVLPIREFGQIWRRHRQVGKSEPTSGLALQVQESPAPSAA